MKYFILLLILGNFSAYAQPSYMYNQKGQLCTDTGLSITPEQYRVWSISENNVAALLADIIFPVIYVENNIQAKGFLIASFVCEKDSIRNIEVAKD